MGAPQYEQAGADIGGTGTTNTIPRWTGASTLGDSGLIDNGTAIYTTTRNVGIGTASPVTTLANTASAIDDGANGVATTGLTWSPNAVGFAAGFWNKYGAVGNGLFVRTSDTSSSTRVFHVCAGAGAVPNSLLFVRGDGNVGIGTASPSTRLHVLASAAPIATFASSSATQGYIQLNYNTSTTFGYIGNGASVIGGGAAGDLGLRSDTGVISFATGGNTERARIDSSGNLILNTATTGATIQAAGSQQGLKLPATPGNADAQTLDCYQENPLATTAGNGWTPTIGGTAAQWGGTLPTVSFARYVQIGSIVFCDVRLTSASIQSTYGVTTITPPPPAQNAFATEAVVPASTTAGGVTGNGAQFGGVVYLPTLAASTAIRLTWFYFTTS